MKVKISERIEDLKKTGIVFGKVLFFSPLYNMSNSKTVISVSIEKGLTSACLLKGFPERLNLQKSNILRTSKDSYPTPEDLASFIDLLSQSNRKERNIILSLPKEWCIVKTADFPDVAEDNLSSVIAYEMDNLTPFPAEEVYFDYDIEKKENNRIYVTLYAVKKQILLPYENAINEYGYSIFKLTLNPLSLIKVCMTHSACSDKSEVMLFKIRETGTLAISSRDGVITSVYAYNGNSSTANSILSTENNTDVDKVIFIDNKDSNKEMEEKVRDLLSQKPETFDSVNLPVKKSFDFNRDYSECIGAALADTNKPVNLLTYGKVERRRIPKALTFTLLLLLVVLLCLHLYIPLEKDRKKIVIIDKKIANLRPQMEEVDAMKREVEVLKDGVKSAEAFLNMKRLNMELIKEITNLLPEDAWVVRMEIDDDDMLLEGYAVSSSILIEILESSEFFKNVSFSSTTIKDKRTNKERFRIKASLENRRDEK